MKETTMATKNALQAVLMALIVVVTVGYVFMFIMGPTNLFRQKWLPKIRTRADSTFFGAQGPSMLMNTFPVLLMAVLSCVYLHSRKKSGGGGGNDYTKGDDINLLGAWKRPIIIKGLGIVTRIELTFLVMFIALLVWSYSVSLHNNFAIITSQSAAKTGEKLWQARMENAALRLGIVGNTCLVFLFFPVARGSPVLQTFGLTSEASIKYHIWLGHIAMVIFTAHGVCYVTFWAVTHRLYEMLEWAKTGIANVAGEIALLAGLAMWATTFPRIRRKFFELFFYTHYLYIVFMLFFLLHVGISYFCYVLPAFYLFLVDRYLRFLQSRENVRLVSARILPSETIELNFSKTRGLTYTPTSIMFLNVPSISRLQWHPFTVSSSSTLEPDHLSVIIKGDGSWTKKLHQILSSPSGVDHLVASVEGPYGPISTDFLRHDLLVLVSGGSGITPFFSIIRELLHASETLKHKTPSVLLISSFKNSLDLAMLDLILPLVNSPTLISNLDLQIEAYVTREKKPDPPEAKKNMSTFWYKPKPTDSPIAPILGRNNWLWLGVIISSSFIIFLILIGIITRYCIYPIDHGTNNIFPSSSRALLNLLVLYICIIVVATAVFLWNKKQNAMESKQIQNLEGATLVDSPESYIADRELESLPQQSLVLATNVHYGERPDLKRILFERKEPSVGVLVCGPKNMRHEVAKICSSGLGPNLHFESICFSW